MGMNYIQLFLIIKFKQTKDKKFKIFDMSKIVKLAQSLVSQQSESSSNSSRHTQNFSRSSHGSQCSHGQNSPHNHHHQDSEVNRSKQKRAFLKKNSRQFLASSKSINKNNKQVSSEAQKQYDSKLKDIKQKDKISTKQYQNQQNQQYKKYPVIPKQNSSRANSKNNSITVTPRMLPIKPQNQKIINNITNKQRMKTQSVQLQRNHHHNDIQENGQVLNPPQSKDLYFNSETVRIQPKVQSFLNCFNKMEGRNKFISNSLDNSQYNSSSYIHLQNQNSNSLQTISLKNSKCIDYINTNPKPKPTPTSYLQANQIQICPELFHLYRTEHLITQANGCTFSLRIYSKGRKQIKYADGTIELFFNNGTQIKLTRWANGDFKLIEGDKVSYWSEEVCDLDQYFLD